MTLRGAGYTIGIVLIALFAYHNGALNLLPTLAAPKK